MVRKDRGPKPGIRLALDRRICLCLVLLSLLTLDLVVAKLVDIAVNLAGKRMVRLRSRLIKASDPRIRVE